MAFIGRGNRMMKKKKVSSYERIRARYGYMFISLWLVGFVIFFLLPFVTSVIYSFNSVKVEIGEVKLTPVGFDNYIGLFLENEEFLPAFTSTLERCAYLVWRPSA